MEFFSIFSRSLFSLLWFVRVAKAIAFWLYLWQLKEYHIGRFLDHFQTDRGRKLFGNPLLKLFLLFLWYSIEIIARFADLKDRSEIDRLVLVPMVGIFLLYFFEAVKIGVDVFQKKFLSPVLTQKIVVLYIVIFGVTLLFWGTLLWGTKWSPHARLTGLVLYDIFVPFLVSGIVLFLQPFVVLWRNRIIQKAKQKRAHLKDLVVIGITGSYGKTSTKEFLSLILSEKCKVVKTKEHRNSEIGISKTILEEVTQEHEVFVGEMGAYNRGGIQLLADIAKPRIAILTGVNEQHLATFGSMENLLSGEGGRELLQSLPKDGIAIFNGDNNFLLDLYEHISFPKRKILCRTFLTGASHATKPDVWAEEVSVEKTKLSFRVVTKDKESADFHVALLGAYNIQNLLLAVAGAKELGMSLTEIANACERITPEMGAMRLRKGANGMNVIDSTYSANPDGVIAALEYLKVWPGRKVIVMPCLIELGKASREVHRKIGEKIGEVCDMAVITTRERFKDIKEGALWKGMREEDILFLEEPRAIVEKIKAFHTKDDVILLESRVPSGLLHLLAL